MKNHEQPASPRGHGIETQCPAGGCAHAEIGNERDGVPCTTASTPASNLAPSGHDFSISGMDCAEEVAVLKRAVGPLVGGDEHLAFDVLNGRMTILETAADFASTDVTSAVARTGMSARAWDSNRKDDRDGHFAQQKLYTAASGICWLIGIIVHIGTAGGLTAALKLFAGHGGQPMPWLEAGLFLLAILFGARFVAVKALNAARTFSPDMNLLMVVAVAGALVIGEWFEAATVAFLFALSLLLESWSVGRARNAVAALLDLTPPTVRVKRPDGMESDVPAAEVLVGSLFIVRSGDRIALDGVVVAGSGAVNQAPITGESIPVTKDLGDDVFAGTINGEGTLEVESTKSSGDTVLARIIRLVGEAHSRRAVAEQWVEKFARVYTPTVMALAVLVFLVPPLLLGGAWDTWFYRALVLLVIACPCALVISTPVSIVAALASSARQGVLIKGGAYIEMPAGLKALALDKTGTLTEGTPEVVGTYPLNGHSKSELLRCAAALEVRSSHPLAQAIVDHAERMKIEFAPAESVEVLPGRGVTGIVNGKAFWLGSHRYATERGQETDETLRNAARLEADGATVVAIGNQSHICGLVALADAIRPEAKAIVSALHSLGVEHLVMLTGDNKVTAEAVAGAVGIDEVKAELLPEDKVSAVEELIQRYSVVAMIGDGVNDAPAMARANFAIAMGAIGSDAAIETADVALMTDDLSRVPWLIAHSRRTIGVIRQNIGFSLAVKTLFVGLTAMGYATLWGAIAADVGASLLVVTNALRLLRSNAKTI